MEVLKACGCGAKYTRGEWLALPGSVRWDLDGENAGDVLELRRCTQCGSHIAVRVACPDQAPVERDRDERSSEQPARRG